MSMYPYSVRLTGADAAAHVFRHLEALVSAAIKRQAAKDNAIVNELLGEWVSELEPVVVRERAYQYTDDGTVVSGNIERIVGLTAKGHDTIAVRRRP